jgi:hypothetical protein
MTLLGASRHQHCCAVSAPAAHRRWSSSSSLNELHSIAITTSFILSAGGGFAASVPFLWNLRFGPLSAFRLNSRRFKKAAIEFYAEGPSCTHVPGCRWYRYGITAVSQPHCQCAVHTPIGLTQSFSQLFSSAGRWLVSLPSHSFQAGQNF